MSLNFDSIPYDPNFNTASSFINKIDTFSIDFVIKKELWSHGKIEDNNTYLNINNLKGISQSQLFSMLKFNLKMLSKKLNFNNFYNINGIEHDIFSFKIIPNLSRLLNNQKTLYNIYNIHHYNDNAKSIRGCHTNLNIFSKEENYSNYEITNPNITRNITINKNNNILMVSKDNKVFTTNIYSHNVTINRNIFIQNDNIFSINKIVPTIINGSTNLNIIHQTRPTFIEISNIISYAKKPSIEKSYISKNYQVNRSILKDEKYVYNYKLVQKYTKFPEYKNLILNFSIKEQDRFVLNFKLDHLFEKMSNDKSGILPSYSISKLDSILEFKFSNTYEKIYYAKMYNNSDIKIEKIQNYKQFIFNKKIAKISYINNISNIFNISKESRFVYPITLKREYLKLSSNISTNNFSNNIIGTIITDHMHPFKGQSIVIKDYGRVSSFISNKIDSTTGRFS